MTTNRATLLALADRVEKASGPDRELDAAVCVAALGMFEEGGSVGFTGRGDMRPPPNFTASIDAALSLVPDGWKWSLHSADDKSKPCAYCVPNMGRLPWPEWVTDIEAATPALALTAAALRALAQEAPSDG